MAALALLTLSALDPTSAGADDIDSKRAEAAAVATKLTEQARRIVAVDVQYRQARERLEDAEAAVAQAEADLQATTKRQADIKRALVVQAQDAYVVGGSVSLLRYLIRTDEGDEVARRAYLRIVTGRDRQLLGQLKAVREDLQDLQKRLDAARKRARADAEAIRDERADLDRLIRSQRAVLDQLNGELAVLVAAEQSRRDAEAARQAAAAREAAAREAREAAARPAAPAQITLEAPAADTWACIRQLESGNNYATPGGGAYQFLDSTWQALGYTGTASDAPPAVQDEAARRLQAEYGWSQWTTAPLCGRL